MSLLKNGRGTKVLLALLVGALATGVASARAGVDLRARVAMRSIDGDTPAVVADGTAQTRGDVADGNTLRIAVGLRVRNSTQLDALIHAFTTPGNRLYGRHLTNAQYLARYAPTEAAVAKTRAWLEGQGLDVVRIAPDNLLIDVRGTIAQLENAFGVSIGSYHADGRTFYSNDIDPTVPAGLNVNWITGLNDFGVYRVTHRTVAANGGLEGSDFRTFYDITGDGAGRTLGFTLWGETLPQSDYDGYANATGTTKLTVGGAGDDGLDFQQIDGSTTESDTDGEVALDTQVAHAVAPSIHETYFIGHDSGSSTMDDVINTAANSGIPAISNSWECDGCSIDGNNESSFQHAISVGTTFYFSSGDNGFAGKKNNGRSYPAVSQYVIAVGGTTSLTADGSGNYVSETAWSGTGSGCDDSESRPSWQTGIGATVKFGNSPPDSCAGRAFPDISADSATCAYVFVDGADSCFIGTSLSAPLWAAMHTVWNKNNLGSGRPALGFPGPVLYALANDPTTYPLDFHDITTGNNGLAAGTGWDEVTGWGTPDFNKISNNLADVTYTGPTVVDKGDSISLSGTLFDHNASTTIATAALSPRKLSIAAGFDNCDATVDGSGHASCNVTVTSDPGRYAAIAAFAGDAAYKGGSQTVDFLVRHIPTKLTYGGPTTTDYNDQITVSATLNDDSNPSSFSSGDPLSGYQLHFSLGAESCNATTNGSGVASCPINPLDDPGPYSVEVTFAGDSTYNASSKSAPFTLTQEESHVAYTGPTTSHYHDSTVVTATLTDPDGGAPIAGKKVTFTLGVGDTCSASTNGSGIASCSIAPTQTGTQTLTATFAGDVDYVSSFDSTAFSITPEETTMAYNGPLVILAGSGGATLTGKLVEDGANDSDGDGGSPGPVPAENVTIAIGGGASCTGTTDSAGNVTCTTGSVSVPLGPETITASFGGDAFYQAATATANAIVFAFPAGGTFAVGDNSAAGSSPVTFWADTWWQQNSLSGGTAPSAFKGFITSIALPTKTPANLCSGNWATLTGNTAPPPAVVPSYMGVVVTKQVKKSGNTFSGGYFSIIVVKVAPGYAPNPFGVGMGPIVAQFC